MIEVTNWAYFATCCITETANYYNRALTILATSNEKKDDLSTVSNIELKSLNNEFKTSTEDLQEKGNPVSL